MTEVFPISKEDQARRPVRYCTRTGEPINRCTCPSCVGRRNRSKGRKKQNAARKGLNIPNSKFRSQQGEEENWRGAVRVEVKSGGIAKPVDTKCRASEAQSDAERPVGDTRPFVAVFMPDGSSDGWVCFRMSKLSEVVPALAEGLYG